MTQLNDFLKLAKAELSSSDKVELYLMRSIQSKFDYMLSNAYQWKNKLELDAQNFLAGLEERNQSPSASDEERGDRYAAQLASAEDNIKEFSSLCEGSIKLIGAKYPDEEAQMRKRKEAQKNGVASLKSKLGSK